MADTKHGGSVTPRQRARTNWQRVPHPATPRPSSVTNYSRSPSTVSNNRRSSVSPGRSLSAPGVTSTEDAEDENEGSKEKRRSNAELERELETIQGCYDNANIRIQELESRCSEMSRKYRTASDENKLNCEHLSDVERENSQLRNKLSSVNSSLDSTKSRLTNMEWKAMEYEKLSILNDNLKSKNESLRQDNRDLERRLQDTDKQLQQLQADLEEKQREVDSVDERMKDLRLQVKEEAIKNIKLEQKVEELEGFRAACAEKESQMVALQEKLTETELLLEHARKAWRQERDKVLEHENTEKSQTDMRDEVDLVRAENMTLKRLIIAKDKIIIQRSRVLGNIKSYLIKRRNQMVETEDIHSLLEGKPEVQASFPVGNKVKQELFGNGIADEATVNGWVGQTARPQSCPPTEANASRSTFMHTLLHEDIHNNNNTTASTSSLPVSPARRPQTAIVRPTNYQSRSFVNFRSDTSDEQSQSQSCVDLHKEARKATTNPHHASPKLKRRQSSNDKRPRSTRPRSTDNSQSRLQRTKSLDNKGSPASVSDTPREALGCLCPGASSSTRASTTSLSTVGSAGSAYVPAIMLRHAPVKDRLFCRLLHLGDRVCVDMARSKEKRRENFKQGIIKFIGNLDKRYDCYKIYIGIKLDDPEGDTDGLYKNKRYFKVPQKHGKFVHITRVTSVQHRQSLRFHDVEELVKKLDESQDANPTASTESFKLKV